MPNDYSDEDSRATELLFGKVVRKVFRHRDAEIIIEFEDNTRLFVDTDGTYLEISIT